MPVIFTNFEKKKIARHTAHGHKKSITVGIGDVSFLSSFVQFLNTCRYAGPNSEITNRKLHLRILFRRDWSSASVVFYRIRRGTELSPTVFGRHLTSLQTNAASLSASNISHFKPAKETYCRWSVRSLL